MHETVYHGVPIIAIPGIADQFHNAARLVNKLGIGKKLEFLEVNEMNLAESINEVLANQSATELRHITWSGVLSTFLFFLKILRKGTLSKNLK